MGTSQERSDRLRANSHGSYTEVLVEKELVQISTTTERVVCHFYLKDFNRCKILDAHLEVSAHLPAMRL